MNFKKGLLKLCKASKVNDPFIKYLVNFKRKAPYKVLGTFNTLKGGLHKLHKLLKILIITSRYNNITHSYKILGVFLYNELMDGNAKYSNVDNLWITLGCPILTLTMEKL